MAGGTARYWRVRDKALEEAARVCDGALQYNRRMQRDAETPELRSTFWQRGDEAERLMWIIRGLKVE